MVLPIRPVVVLALILVTFSVAAQETRPEKVEASGRKALGDPDSEKDKPAESGFPSVPVESAAEAAARIRIQKALARTDAFVYPDISLADVMSDIGTRFKVPVVLDRKSLEDAAIGTDIQIATDLNGITLKSFLEIALAPLGISYWIGDEVLWITSQEFSEFRIKTRLYDVSDLISQPDQRVVYGRSGRGKALIQFITQTIAPETWSDAGGIGQIAFLDEMNVLAVSQANEVLTEIDDLLRILKHMRTTKTPAPANESAADDSSVTRIYALRPAKAPSQTNLGGFNAASPDDVQSLAKFISATIQPDSWRDSKGVIGVFRNDLLVRQTRSVHQQIEQVLADLDLLREATTPEAGGGLMVPGVSGGLGGGGGLFSVVPAEASDTKASPKSPKE